MGWTRSIPDEIGYYWLRSDNDGDDEYDGIVWVENPIQKEWVFWSDGEYVTLDFGNLGSHWWYGPLEAPPFPLDEQGEDGDMEWPVCPFCKHVMVLEWYDDGTLPMWECECDADVLEEMYRKYFGDGPKPVLPVSFGDQKGLEGVEPEMAREKKATKDGWKERFAGYFVDRRTGIHYYLGTGMHGEIQVALAKEIDGCRE